MVEPHPVFVGSSILVEPHPVFVGSSILVEPYIYPDFVTRFADVYPDFVTYRVTNSNKFE
ncbi:MAG: hypothetical protein KAW88_03875 [Candidatus Cloacimonetes bacterium]|nr:hypothetical protein [Candidatus Cloacimonadota bacterium]